MAAAGVDLGGYICHLLPVLPCPGRPHWPWRTSPSTHPRPLSSPSALHASVNHEKHWENEHMYSTGQHWHRMAVAELADRECAVSSGTVPVPLCSSVVARPGLNADDGDGNSNIIPSSHVYIYSLSLMVLDVSRANTRHSRIACCRRSNQPTNQPTNQQKNMGNQYRYMTAA